VSAVWINTIKPSPVFLTPSTPASPSDERGQGRYLGIAKAGRAVLEHDVETDVEADEVSERSVPQDTPMPSLKIVHRLGVD